MVVLEENVLRIELSGPFYSRLSFHKRPSTSVTTVLLGFRLGEPLEWAEMRRLSLEVEGIDKGQLRGFVARGWSSQGLQDRLECFVCV